jgi:hypothetical protein
MAFRPSLDIDLLSYHSAVHKRQIRNGADFASSKLPILIYH